MVLPPSLQDSLPAGWLAFAGREFNPLDHDKRFQFVSSSSSGFSLAQGKFQHGVAPLFQFWGKNCAYETEKWAKVIRTANIRPE